MKIIEQTKKISAGVSGEEGGLLILRGVIIEGDWGQTIGGELNRSRGNVPLLYYKDVEGKKYSRKIKIVRIFDISLHHQYISV